MELEKKQDAWIRDLGNEMPSTRCAAAYALGKIGDEHAVDQLAKALKDGYFSVRMYAVESLGAIGHEGAIVHLIDALEDESLEIRASVVSALAKITNLFFSTPQEWQAWFARQEARPSLT